MRRILLPTLVSLLLVSSSTFAQTSGMWGQRGTSKSFAIRGNFLYSADGRGVSVFDISQPDAIERVDLEWSDDETAEVAIMGNELVVATNRGVERFAIAGDGRIDRLQGTNAVGATTHIVANANYAAAVSNKTVSLLERNGAGLLSVPRRLMFSDPVTAVAFVGDLLYVAADREPLRVFEPASSTAIDLLPGVDAAALALSDTESVLWTASADDGLTAIDVSNPREPQVLSKTGTNELHLDGVTAAGTRVYAFESPDVVRVFDATDAHAPQLVATMNEWVNVLAASGTRLFLAGPIVEDADFVFDAREIPRETGKPVRSFDTTHLATPSLLAEAEDLAGPVTGVWTDGSIAYVIDPPYLRVLDVSKTSEPRELSHMTVPKLQDKIRVKNGLAIIYGRAFVNMLDVSDVLHPRYLGTWDARGHSPSAAAILEGHVIEANQHSGMHVVSFDDPANPVQIGGRKWHYTDIAAGDDAAYALQSDIMLVVGIENQQKIVDKDVIELKYEQVDVAPPNSSRPGYLVARGDDGLRVYSLADRFHPQELDFLEMTGLGMFVTGDSTAYITKDRRLQFVDLAGGTLSLVPTEMYVTAPVQMSMAGEKIVVADRYSVRVFGPDTAAPPPVPQRRRGTRH